MARFLGQIGVILYCGQRYIGYRGFVLIQHQLLTANLKLLTAFHLLF